MDVPDGVCVLCTKLLSEGVIVEIGLRRIESIKTASVRRQDYDVQRMMRGLSSVKVHVNCNKSYVNERCILAHLKSIATIGRSSSRGTVNELTFDFGRMCFLCNSDASDDFILRNNKKPASRRETVRNMTRDDALKNMIKIAQDRADDMGELVASRLSLITDISAVNAVYHDSCMKKFRLSKSIPTFPQESEDKLKVVIAHIQNYIEASREECQFRLSDVLEGFNEDDLPSRRAIKERLLQIYGNDIIIAKAGCNKEAVICFRDYCNKVIIDKFYKHKLANENEERERIVAAAGKIIIDDIRSRVYETDFYPSSDSFLENVENVIPKTLLILLETVILKNKVNVSPWRKKILSIAHAIISAARPRSFISPLQIGLAAMLDRQHGSKDLLNMLSALGFCSSYNDFAIFEASVLSDPKNVTISSTSYSQFVFDNADHNVRTLDGYNTFHAMGGIHCVTPSSCVTTASRTPKLKKVPKAFVTGNFGHISVQVFQRHGSKGLGNVEIQDLNIRSSCQAVDLSATDFLWLFGMNTSAEIRGWNSFMESIFKEKSLSQSRVLFLPFINSPPSDYNTVYTVLLEAANKCKELNQQYTFVTFDQPLYWKAREILECMRDKPELQNIIVRLGGFHLLMSFLGSIGNLMSNSGLKELLSQAYAPLSIDKMLNGHAYARAVRAHILVHLALGKIILQSAPLTSADTDTLTALIKNFENANILQEISTEKFTEAFKRYTSHIQNLAENGPTAKLWVQYFNMVSLMKQFIEAERSGNWQLHIDTIQKMIPYFHAAGHFLYAKSAHLYLQDMLTLKQKLNESEYKKFVLDSFFTIKRSAKGWSGVWTDMTIEQTLMKSGKIVGGYTHGRGTSENVLTKWTTTMPVLVSITESLRNFSEVSYCTSEQHVDASASRVKRDIIDLNKFLDWLKIHNPFPDVDAIISISTGIKGHNSVNCYDAVNIGLANVDCIIGNNFSEVHFRRKNKAVSLHTSNSIKIDNETVSINPTLLFQRICFLKKSDEELKHYFTYELAPYPLSLFDECGVRKTQKSKLYDYFTCLPEIPTLESNIHVVDGGFFIHRVVWHEKETFGKIVGRYVNYAKKHYAENSFFIFDGYSCPSESSTKGTERQRRFLKNCAPEVIINECTIPSMSQEKFLSNSQNKENLIKLLVEKLEKSEFRTSQAIEDADRDIAYTALSACKTYKNVVIVAEDIDILVILTQCSTETNNWYFLKPGKGKIEDKMYTIDSFKYPSVKHLVAFMHAFSGCDTTSAFYKQGKAKFVKCIVNNPDLVNIAEVFNRPDSLPEHLYIAGEKIILSVYGCKGRVVDSLDEFRYQCFCKSVLRNTNNLASLPPTKKAAMQHCLRVFYQVQTWLGQELKPEVWGWTKSNVGLIPTTALNTDCVPTELLNMISCKCMKGCKVNCGCRKVGLKCTNLCLHCRGTECNNCEKIIIDDESDSNDALEEVDDIEKNPDMKYNVHEDSSLNIQHGDDVLNEPIQKRRKM